MSDLESFIKYCDEYQINNENEILIGSFYNNSFVMENCSFGKFQYNGPNYVHIFMNDGGSIPHVHITDKENPRSKNLKIDYCVKLMVSEVYPHGNKHNKYGKGRSTINNAQKEKINEFMRSYNDKNKMTNWEFAVMMWNSAPRNIYVTDNLTMPNYLNIE